MAPTVDPARAGTSPSSGTNRPTGTLASSLKRPFPGYPVHKNGTSTATIADLACDRQTMPGTLPGLASAAVVAPAVHGVPALAQDNRSPAGMTQGRPKRRRILQLFEVVLVRTVVDVPLRLERLQALPAGLPVTLVPLRVVRSTKRESPVPCPATPLRHEGATFLQSGR